MHGGCSCEERRNTNAAGTGDAILRRDEAFAIGSRDTGGKRRNPTIEKKKIDTRAAGSLLEKLDSVTRDNSIVSLRRFIALNLDTFSRFIRFSGGNVRTLYEYLKAGGLDVGTYHGFRSACYRTGLRRRTKKNVPVLGEGVCGTKNPARLRARQKEEGAAATVESGDGSIKHNPTLPSVYLPGGVEAIIDPETGAKCFEIKSGKTEKESE
jgi:hypothetical protein